MTTPVGMTILLLNQESQVADLHENGFSATLF
jgi:hypothetical protein